jgi:membrane AbrB-like protein
VEQFFGICLVFAVGSAGFFLLRLLRAPNPALIGSLAATGALNIAGYYPVFLSWPVSFLASAAIGMIIGKSLDRNITRNLRAMLRPVCIQLAGILLLSFLCGYVLYAAGGGSMDFGTALISGTAGGITEMVIFGASIDADIAVIAVMQLFRVVSVIAIIPYLAILGKKMLHGSADRKKNAPVPQIAAPRFRPRDYAVLVPCSLAGAAAGYLLKIPAGTMLGSMLACGGVAMLFNRTYTCSPKLRIAAQIALGSLLGQRLAPQIVGQLPSLLLPILLTTAIMLFGCMLLALLLFQTTAWDMTTCLLCSAPAGLSQITLFAEEIGANTLAASVFHTVRILGIVSLYPMLVMPVIQAFGGR